MLSKSPRSYASFPASTLTFQYYKADELVIALAPLKVASNVATNAADQMKATAAGADPAKLLSSV